MTNNRYSNVYIYASTDGLVYLLQDKSEYTTLT
jgi:hypothetical protein